MTSFKIDGVDQIFIPLKAYRAQHNLPADFHINYFEGKTYEGLGSIESATPELNSLRTHILNRLGNFSEPQAWLNHQPPLQNIFQDELLAINHHIGLRDPEVGFAMAGFGDVCHQWIYALIYAKATKQALPSFNAVYREWLMNSLRVAHTEYTYDHMDETWIVQIISHAYGRIGMEIQRPTATDYVLDVRLACPAENFMDGLLGAVAEHIRKACGV